MRILAMTAAATAVLAGGVLPTAAQAQALKNEVSIATNVDASSTSCSGCTSTNTTTSSVFGSYGYYFTPRLVGLLGMGFVGSTSSSSGSPSTTTSVFILDVGAKYYFGDFKKGDFVPFVDLTLEAASARSDSGGNSTTISGGGLSGGGGFSYFVTEQTSFDASLNLYGRSLTSNVAGSPTLNQSGVVLALGFTTRF